MFSRSSPSRPTSLPDVARSDVALPDIARPDAAGADATQPDAAWQAETQITGYLRFAGVAIIVLVVGLGGWSASTSIDGAVVASGLIAVESDSKSVQHLEGGIISDILVRDGDKVKAGDWVIVLDALQLREQIAGLDAQIAAARAEAELLANELESLRQLQAKGLVTKTRITALKRQKAKTDGEFGRLTAERARMKDGLARTAVRAPISGTVHNMAFRTIGGVVAPGQEILKIVPVEDRVIVSARLNPADVDEVFKDQPVAIRLPGLDQATTPELVGAVDTISADLSYDEKSRSSFYEVRISLDDQQPVDFDALQLVPGMPADAYVRTGSRTVLSYLLQPVTDQLSRAFRE